METTYKQALSAMPRNVS